MAWLQKDTLESICDIGNKVKGGAWYLFMNTLSEIKNL